MARVDLTESSFFNNFSVLETDELEAFVCIRLVAAAKLGGEGGGEERGEERGEGGT